MRSKIISLLKVVTVLAVLFLAYLLRENNYENIPTPGESLDEYSYSWVGMSLIKTGVPVGISGIDGYELKDKVYINVDRIYQKSSGRSTPLTISRPWFDHPPTLGLITGGYAYLKGARVFEDASTFLIRKPMIFLGVLTVGLVMALAWINFGYLVGISAGMIYATTPLLVISSRMIQAENGVIPMFLLSLICYSLYKRNRKELMFVLAVIFSGLAVLFKISGIAVFLSLVILMWLDRINLADFGRKLLKAGVIFLPMAMIFVVYGLAIDANMFIKIFSTNSNRFYGIGSGSLYNLITQSKLTGLKTISDGWILSGWLAVISTVSRIKKEALILVVPFVVYLAIYILFGSESYGWYAYPLWPMAIIMLARLLIKSGNILISFLLTLIPIGFLISRLTNIEDFQKYSDVWRWGLFGIMISGLMVAIPSSKLLKKYANPAMAMCLVLVACALNVIFLNKITIESWYGMW